MTRSELVTRIAEQNPYLYARQVEAVVDAILDWIAGALAAGDRVELRDFGTFCVRNRVAYSAWNPRTGEPMVTKAKGHVYFRLGKGMRTRLNRKLTDDRTAFA